LTWEPPKISRALEQVKVRRGRDEENRRREEMGKRLSAWPSAVEKRRKGQRKGNEQRKGMGTNDP
jgi:hypothetical protein